MEAHGPDHGVDHQVDHEPVESRPHRKLRLRRRESALITDATRSAAQNRRSREIQYLFWQGLRIPFIILSIVSIVAWNNWWLAALFFSISIPLPWISVVVANGQGEKRDKRAKNVYKPGAARQAAVAAQQRAALTEADGSGTYNTPATIDHYDDE